MRPLVLALVLVLIIVNPLRTPTVSSDPGDIQVLDSEAVSDFPDGIRFYVTVKSSVEIDDIRVFFHKVGQRGTKTYRSVDFEPGNMVTGTSMLKSAGGGADYFPPGTRIEFSFEVRDIAGSVLRTPDQDFIYQDNRFEWLTVEEGLITVYYYGEAVEERARAVLEAADAALERMMPILGIEPTEPLRIVTYNNYRHMSAAIPFRAQAVRDQLLTQGMAFSEERVLLVQSSDVTVKGITSHEFTHLLIAEAAGNADSQLPAWLNEGLAEYGNIDPTNDYDRALSNAIETDRLRPLWYLSQFGGTPSDIIIAYGHASSVVQFMIDWFGPEQISHLFKAFQESQDIDSALQQVYGVDQYGLDNLWRESIGIDPLPPPPAEEPIPPTPLPTPSPAPSSTAAPTQVVSADAEAGGSSSPGCSAPQPRGAASLGILALLAAPLGLLAVRGIKRNRE